MKQIILIILSILLVIIQIIGVGFNMLNLINKKDINSIKLLEYEYSDGRMIYGNVLYKLECDKKCKLITKLKGYPDEEVLEVELSKDKYSKILKLIQDNNVQRWDGFDKSDKNVLDGTGSSVSFRKVVER